MTLVGAFAREIGVTLLDGLLAVPVPKAFIAATVNVYDTPFIKPVSWIGLEVPVATIFPGEETTTY